MDLSQGKNRELLNTEGLRVTTQRALILDIIRRRQGHLDADEIHRQAQITQPRISLSTVYRTLQVLKKLQLVKEVRFDESHHHYEIKSSTIHHHLVCLNCGRVIEFNYPLARLVKRNVAEAKDFEITGSELQITGYCSDCRKKK